MTFVSATFPTPDGPFSIIACDDAVLASGWTADTAELLALIHPDLRPEPGAVVRFGFDDASGALAEVGGGADAATEMLAKAVAAVHAYYEGDHRAIDAVPVRQTSGPYREHAWDVLRAVEPGQAITYTHFAERTGRPAATRAAAGACAMNAAALFVPCHRVLRSDGTLGGFRYGLPIKNALLLRESVEA